MSPRRDYTLEEVELAVRLHDQDGVGWDEIARRLNRSKASVMTTVCHFRKGTWQPKRRGERSRRINRELEALVVEQGVTSGVEIARRVGINYDAARTRLASLGLDLEMRQLAARDLNERRAA